MQQVVSVTAERIAAVDVTIQVETVLLGFNPGSVYSFLGALFDGDREDRVVGIAVRADLLADHKVNGGDVLVVVLLLGDREQFAADVDRVNLPNLDLGLVVVVDGGHNRHTDFVCLGDGVSFPVVAALGDVLANLQLNLLGGGLFAEAEAALTAVGRLAPDLPEVGSLLADDADAGLALVLDG